MEVEGCGTGLLLIRRDCIEEMLKKLPNLSDHRSHIPITTEGKLSRLIRAFQNLSVDGRRLSEDFSFCHRWRRLCGGEVWANVKHPITHVGLQHFNAKFESARRASRLVIDTSKSKIALPTKPPVLGNRGRKTVAAKIEAPREEE